MRPPPASSLRLPAFKQQTRDIAISTAPVPNELVLPLNQHSDQELSPCVQVNNAVRKGQPIAKPDSSLSAWLHSPVSGTVVAIKARPNDKPATGFTRSIIIANDRLDTIDTSFCAASDWHNQSAALLCERLAQGGIAGLGGAVFPTATKLATQGQHAIEHLLINGVECEPYITCDDRLMRERAADIVQGIQILLQAAQTQHCIIAIEADKPEALIALRAAVVNFGDSRLEVRAVATAYPNGDEGQLIAQLLDREIPRGGLPAHVGVIVQNVATAYACARWILQAEPLISRIVTVTGQGVVRPANLEVRLGTPIATLIDHCGGYQAQATRLIMGGAMMGRALSSDELPIVKASNCYIVATQYELPNASAELPCIRCGECMQVCPAGLLPQQLLVYIRADNREALKDLGLYDCIECGGCDLVCPSHIVLAERFRAAKVLGAQ